MQNHSNKKPELCLERATEISRRQAVQKLLAEIKRTAPAWAGCAPWIAERLIEGARQRQLPGIEAHR